MTQVTVNVVELKRPEVGFGFELHVHGAINLQRRFNLGKSCTLDPQFAPSVAIKRAGYFGLASRRDASRLAVPHSSIDGLAYLVDRNTKANPHVASRGTGNRGSDSNKLSAQVHKWTTRVTRIEGGIGLNEVLGAFEVETGAVQGAYNSVTNGYSPAERIADSNEIVADFQRLRGRHGKSDKVGRSHSYHRNIRIWIGINKRTLKAPPI